MIAFKTFVLATLDAPMALGVALPDAAPHPLDGLDLIE